VFEVGAAAAAKSPPPCTIGIAFQPSAGEFTMQARCLCKAVLVTAPDTHEVHVCHCSMCRRWGEGPAFTLHGGTAVQTSGPVTRYASSPWAERAFCSSCGTHLFYRLLASNEHFLSAGLFQDAQGLTGTADLYRRKARLLRAGQRHPDPDRGRGASPLQRFMTGFRSGHCAERG